MEQSNYDVPLEIKERLTKCAKCSSNNVSYNMSEHHEDTSDSEVIVRNFTVECRDCNAIIPTGSVIITRALLQ